VASANSVVYMSADQVYFKRSYSSYLNSNGDYRFIDGNPTSDGNDTGRPSEYYDHVIVGYNSSITTDTVKFWAEDYIPVELVRVDYSHDGEYFFEVPTHEGNVSFVFDDSIKIYETEDVPSGQYIYTVALPQQYTAKYWRVRSFISTHNMDEVAQDITGKDILMSTTSGLPASSNEYGSGYFYYNSNDVVDTSVAQTTSYGGTSVNYDGTYDLSDVKFYSTTPGTVEAGAFSILIQEQIYSYHTFYRCAVGWPVCTLSCNHPGNNYIDFPECYESFIRTDLDSVNTLFYAENTEDFDLSGVGYQFVDVTVDGYLPEYSYTYGPGPNGGNLIATVQYSIGSSIRRRTSYNSINGNTLGAVSISNWPSYWDFPSAQNFYYSYPMKLTQVKIPKRTGPQLRYWESDGSTAVTNTSVLDNVYDMVYDIADEAFYVVRFNETGGVGNPIIHDNFSTVSGESFNTAVWDIYGNSFFKDALSNCLVFENTVSGVRVGSDLLSKAYFTGDFDTTLPVVVDTLSGTGYYGSVVRDVDNDNQVGGIYAIGEWGTDPADRGLTAVVIDSLTNATDSVVSFNSLRIDPYNLLEGEASHTFDYITGSGWYYTRENITYPGQYEIDSRFSAPNAIVVEDGFSVVLEDNDQTVSNGSSVSFVTERFTISGINSDTVDLYTTHIDSTDNIQFSYDDTVVNDTLLNRTVETFGANLKANITGATTNFITASSTSFDSNGAVGWDIPCLEVYTLNSDGDLSTVSGVSTGAGVVLQTFDIIETPGGRYEDWFGKVSIITTNETEAQGGSIFLRVGTDLYKYNKTTLPLTGRETGTNVSVLASGTLPYEYTKGFNYDDYVVGGVSFIVFDEERSGVFLRTVSDSTLLLSGYESQLNLVNDDVPFARDAEDSGVLYTVIDNDVYLLNADETSVAFCNVVSSDPILPASSSYTATITARVVNMFGEPLQGKKISFSITSGDGSLTPTYGCSTSSGTVSTVFTAASSVGTSVITATASNDSC